MSERSYEPRGLATFLMVWGGQVVSLLGSNLTGFALSVWVYHQTDSTTRFALIALATTLPGIVMSPFAGALVDRWDRRRAMILSDAGAGCATLVLALLIWQERLELWHIYLLLSVRSFFGAFQWPAFSAATTLLVPKRHLGRGSGLTQMGTAAGELLAPVLAGALVVTVGLRGVVLIDVVTFACALATLLAVRIPRPEVSAEGAAARGSLALEARVGWSYLRRRPGLLALLFLFASTNLSLGMMQVLIAPMVLSFAPADVLGRVLSASGLGMLAGSILMSVWGGPRHRIPAILLLLALQGSVLIVGGLRPSALLIAAAGFVFLLALPLITGINQALWQSKVEPDLQGRVFAVRRMIAWSTLPLAYLLAGPLADGVFEPLLTADGLLAGNIGLLIGTGAGRGIALLLIVLGGLVLLTVAVASRSPRLRRLEEDLPDTLGDESRPAAPQSVLAALERN